MLSCLVRISLVLLVMNSVLPPCSALRSFGNRGNSGGKNNNGKPKTMAGTSSGLPALNSTRRGLGISAWGIVAIIVSLILAGMGFYYFSMCYPILCIRNTKYDMISLPSVV